MWALWKIRARAEDKITPNNTIFACLDPRKTSEDISNKIKPAKIYQKLPTSNIVPNKDTCELLLKRTDNKTARTIPNPDTKSQDFGKIILPSRNLEIAQNISANATPMTNNNPFDVSTGMLVNGKQKIGNKTTTKNNDQKESFSNIFEFINFENN
jgi:hypothetical protein